ncbi:beta-ketoacyl-[acyl-carrier-protein] synthase family protein [Puniceicoccaceae bacterium K14]|nr:beta-ketoacyl-[acyl-carrier-protein] synthase family protein [Puniceicoccaceae bacterium K14]
MQRRKVYLTGVGFISSIGNSRSAVLDSLKGLRHGFASYPPFENDPKADVKLVSAVKDFELESTDFEDWELPPPYKIRREYLRGLPPHGVYVHCAMQQAIEDAQLSEEEYSNINTGIYTASAGSPKSLYHNMNRMRQLGPMRCPPTGIVSSISGTLSFNLVASFKIQGSSCGFSSACASSGHAIGFAYDEIVLGRQERMFIAAGEDLNYESVLPFAGMRALSLEGTPSRASCPFDTKRNGFVSAGGGVVLVLESEEEMMRRGATPYAELMGWGQSSDGYNVAISHPEGVGLSRAMELAISSCGLVASDIDYLNAHATSTLIGDASEGKAIKEVFIDKGACPKVSSTKAITGHGLSLASALEAGIVGLSIAEGITPGSAHINEVDPVFQGLDIIQKTENQAPKIAMSNSSGFGGANVSLIFKNPN